MTVPELSPHRDGARSIAVERARQINKGFTAAHDSHHAPEEFVIQAGHLLRLVHRGEKAWCDFAANSRDDLVRAGALIAAAIDRHDEIAKGRVKADPITDEGEDR